MSGAATLTRALVVADMPDDDILAMAHAGMTETEIADRVGARSGLTYIRADDVTAWLLDINGACRNCGERAATTTDHNRSPRCRVCSSHAAAMGQED